MKVSASSTPGSVSHSTKSQELEDKDNVISGLVNYINLTSKYDALISRFDFSRITSSAFVEDNDEEVQRLSNELTNLSAEDGSLSFSGKGGNLFFGMLIKVLLPVNTGHEYRVLCVVDVNEYLTDYRNSQLDMEFKGILKSVSCGKMVLFTKDDHNRINKVFVGEKESYLYSGVKTVGKCDFKTPESQIKRPVMQIRSGFFSDFAIVHTDAKIVLIPSETADKVEKLFYSYFGIPATKVKVKTEKTSRMGKDCIIS